MIHNRYIKGLSYHVVSHLNSVDYLRVILTFSSSEFSESKFICTSCVQHG